MEAGGLITEVGWTEFDFLSHGEESEVMAQLLGAFPSHDDDLSSVQEYGAAEFVNMFSNHSPNFYGNGGRSCEDVDGPSMSMLNSVSATNKRKHLAGELDGQTRGRKCARRGETKRTKRAKQSGDEDPSMAIASGSPTSCCTSDSDSNASLESADADARPKGKARAGRGATTEPQSIYARKRRERINERLKILQNLVPNGTKVDISTMLEEAVHYVKFLQLQIRLLSSDDMWMYAPIAYNGMNIGIDLNMDR
ncbi:hypothetical protein PAHAL_3G480000 [Panicum hallii]|uniref:BHLH domain-containing protein n=1 Tax=Panicum hallii TaxID=206008 RepID=A0A2T8KLU5_9POAL|nr:transcription factor bHLH139-like isoform X2 [Panicum hallii]PVH63140.1 hypothetical protein PAHAL_3G480000 [Panicum hallii]